MASSPCGPFLHSDSALQDPAHPAQPMRLQHAWSAPGALQDDSISLSPSTPARPQHVLHQMPQDRMYAETPTYSIGGYTTPERSMLRYPAPETPGVAPRSHPMGTPQEVRNVASHRGIPISNFVNSVVLRLSLHIGIKVFWSLNCLCSRRE